VEVPKIFKGPFHNACRHHAKLIHEIQSVLHKEFSQTIKIKDRPSMSFDDMKKHYFFMNKEIINFQLKL
jgi:hypothetical protein